MFGIPVLSFVAGELRRYYPRSYDWRGPSRSDQRLAISCRLLASVLTFCWFPGVNRWRNSVLMFDATGLALLAVSGTQKALALGLNPVMAALLGMVTGIGRQSCARCSFRRDPNRAARRSICRGRFGRCGGSGCRRPAAYSLNRNDDAGAALCFGLRLMAIRRGWQLPTAVLASILRKSLELRNTGTKVGQKQGGGLIESARISRLVRRDKTTHHSHPGNET